jgi:chromosome segregation ATPase
MSESTKQLTAEELQSIKDLQQQYNKFVFELGSIEAQLQALLTQKTRIETEKDNIISDITKLGDREREVVTAFQEKYGVGNIHPETGESTAF